MRPDTLTSSPRFRSTAAFAARRRSTAPSVERATFVSFSLGGQRFAAPVESVERVLRWRVELSAPTHVMHAGREVPLVDLAAHLGLVASPSGASRVLVIVLPGGWLAAVVDEVHEIATVDAASIGAVAGDDRAGHVMGVRGTFTRQGHESLVLDMTRALGFGLS